MSVFFFSIFFAVGLSTACMAQFIPFDERHAELGLENTILVSDSTLRQEYKLSTSIYLNEYWSVYYSFGMSNNFANKRSYSVTTGSAAAFLLLREVNRNGTASQDSQDFWVWVGILACIIPEGIEFHASLGRRTSLTPFLSPLSTYYASHDDERLRLGGNIGLRLNFYPRQDLPLCFSPMGGMRFEYGGLRHELFGGFKIGVVF